MIYFLNNTTKAKATTNNKCPICRFSYTTQPIMVLTVEIISHCSNFKQLKTSQTSSAVFGQFHAWLSQETPYHILLSTILNCYQAQFVIYTRTHINPLILKIMFQMNFFFEEQKVLFECVTILNIYKDTITVSIITQQHQQDLLVSSPCIQIEYFRPKKTRQYNTKYKLFFIVYKVYNECYDQRFNFCLYSLLFLFSI
jgi:hypothetical protein